ncbi:MAG: bifunctional phosphoribosyl-AMP cyclohydrolase/phosphoribosyl-ATP diphosphatase HisIE [Lachnospiraceae bacterium]|nr:bifunctional phosphoribosyl-AMP cyclohydrolase/phosphoribosyl-ATP diphosphatase HisIE [Lachnospiraceae bacterium]
MSYKTLNPCILISKGKAIHWFDDDRIFSDDVVQLAKHYSDMGADELIIFDLSETESDKEIAIDLVRKMNRVISIPSIVGGNIRRLEDVKKILYAGARRALLNFSKPESLDLIEEVSNRFGKDRIGVSLRDFDELYKQQNIIEQFSSEIIFMHRLDLDSIGYVTEVPSLVVTDVMEQEEVFRVLSSKAVKGVSGKFISQKDMGYVAFKELCEARGIQMSTYESTISFEDLKKDATGLVPVIVQDYKNKQVLMMAYMNEDAFDHTLRTGQMTYYSRSRKKRWVKGETSGNYQYVKHLIADCDSDALLAQVEQLGSACHTGNVTCFFNKIIENDAEHKNLNDVLESVYHTIHDRKINPKVGSYTNYLFDKGLDKILKKMGEEASEIIIAAKNPNAEEIKYEIADFLYHTMVMMVERQITWEDILYELSDR